MNKLLYATALCAALTGTVYAEKQFPTIAEHGPECLRNMCGDGSHNKECTQLEAMLYWVKEYNKNPDDWALSHYIQMKSCNEASLLKNASPEERMEFAKLSHDIFNKEEGLPSDTAQAYWVTQLANTLKCSPEGTVECLRDLHETLLRLKKESQKERAEKEAQQ